jgi:hypothetical protein
MRPPATTVYILTLAGVLVVAGIVGYSVGRVAHLGNIIEQVADKDAGELMFHVEALTRLRLGEKEEAIQLLETLVDGEIITVSQPDHYPSARLSRSAKKQLGVVKAYRQKYPSSEPAVLEALRQASETADLACGDNLNARDWACLE